MTFVAAAIVLALGVSSGTGGDTDLVGRLAGGARALADSGFAGQVVVARGDRVLLDAAYGFADGGHTPVTRETRFDTASLTKAFTAAAVLRLRDEGRIELSTPIEPFFPEAPESTRGITVEELLSHTGGLGMSYAADGETDRDAAVRKLLSRPLSGPPGGAFRYSDDGYVLLAAIIEVASGMTYEHYVSERLFAPAGLEHTSFWGGPEMRDASLVAGFMRPLPPEILSAQWGQRGSGGVLSTAGDLYRWNAAFRAGRIVADSTVAELTRERRRLTSGIGVGYGWFWSDGPSGSRRLWSRGNEDFGPNAILLVAPAYVIAVTSNRFSGEEPWSRRMAEELESVLLGAR